MPDIRSEDREVQQYRTPPYSKEAEDGVLGALLIDNNTFDLIGGKIDSEDFYDYGNRLIFENIKRLLSQGKPADIGGYYLPDAAKLDAVMRPSATFNAALAVLA